jgi:hypothetical protein
MGDLEQVDPRQATLQQRRIDAFLDIAGQQEPPPVRLAEQHDRDVVDRGSRVRGIRWDGAGVGPQDLHRDLAEAESRAGGQHAVRRPVPEGGVPGCPTGAGSPHAGLVHAADGIPLEDPGEARNVVLVGVGQDDDVKAPVPRRDPLVECDEDTVGVRPAVDEHPGAGSRLKEDGVALSDVQHGDPGRAPRRVADSRPAERDRDRPGDDRSPACGRDMTLRAVPGRCRPFRCTPPSGAQASEVA